MERTVLCGVVTWISVCSLHPECSPAASQGANTGVAQQQRFHLAQHTWYYSEDLGSQGGPSQAHLPRCSRHRAPLSTPQQCIPSPKPKDDGDTCGQVLRCKSCSCSQQRAGLICAMGAREVSNCRAMTMMLSEPLAPRSLPFGLSSIFWVKQRSEILKNTSIFLKRPSATAQQQGCARYSWSRALTVMSF